MMYEDRVLIFSNMSGVNRFDYILNENGSIDEYRNQKFVVEVKQHFFLNMRKDIIASSNGNSDYIKVLFDELGIGKVLT